VSEAGDRETGNGAPFFVAEPYGPANSSGHADERLDADAANAGHQICFHEAV
jgi:hypothetical protein